MLPSRNNVGTPVTLGDQGPGARFRNAFRPSRGAGDGFVRQVAAPVQVRQMDNDAFRWKFALLVFLIGAALGTIGAYVIWGAGGVLFFIGVLLLIVGLWIAAPFGGH